MASILNDILNEFKKIKGISSAALVSRSGMFIAGEVPVGSHTETYAAMAAIILGAAEATSTEIKLEMNHINVDFNDRWQYLFGCSSKALLVLFTETPIDFAQRKAEISDLLDKLIENLM